MNLLLDTNILLYITRDESEHKLLDFINPMFKDIHISYVSIAEIESIAFQNNWGKKKVKRLEGLLDACQIIKVDDFLLRAYVEIDAFSQRNHPDFLTYSFASSRNMGKNDLKNGASFITNAVATTTSTLATATLVPIFVFFFLLYRDFFRHFFYQLFSSKHKRKVDIGIRKIYDVVQSYLVGLILVIIIVGILNSAGLLLLGIDHAIFFGFFAAFLLLIPYIGVMIGSILPALMALITKDSPMYALAVLAIFGVVQFLEGNFITPNIVGSKVSINPMAAMIVLILWGNLWGVSGLILALPCIAIIKVIFDLVEPLKPFGYLLGDAE